MGGAATPRADILINNQRAGPVLAVLGHPARRAGDRVDARAHRRRPRASNRSRGDGHGVSQSPRLDLRCAGNALARGARPGRPRAHGGANLRERRRSGGGGGGDDARRPVRHDRETDRSWSSAEARACSTRFCLYGMRGRQGRGGGPEVRPASTPGRCPPAPPLQDIASDGPLRSRRRSWPWPTPPRSSGAATRSRASRRTSSATGRT